jgi:hypothetical protein
MGLTLRGLTLRGLTLMGLTLMGLTLMGLTLMGLTLMGLTLRGLTSPGLCLLSPFGPPSPRFFFSDFFSSLPGSVFSPFGVLEKKLG